MELEQQLGEVQKQVIGVFYPHASNKMHLVIKNDNGFLKCIFITPFLDIHTVHIHENGGKLILLPKMTLSEMMNDPIYFYHWYELYVKPIEFAKNASRYACNG